MTENKNDNEIKKIENLLKKEGNKFKKEEIDLNFVNNLKFSLKDKFEENKKKSSKKFWGLMSWYRSPAIGAVITGVIIIAVVFEVNTVNKLDIHFEPNVQDDAGVYSAEEPIQKMEKIAEENEAERTKQNLELDTRSNQEIDASKQQKVDYGPKPTETTESTSSIPNTPQASSLAIPNDEATYSEEPGVGNTEGEEATNINFTIEAWTISVEEAGELLKKELQKIGVSMKNSYIEGNSFIINFVTNGENAMQIINAIELNPNNSIYTKIEDFYEYAEDQTNIEIEIILSLKSE